jgi:hypothetical protein
MKDDEKDPSIGAVLSVVLYIMNIAYIMTKACAGIVTLRFLKTNRYTNVRRPFSPFAFPPTFSARRHSACPLNSHFRPHFQLLGIQPFLSVCIAAHNFTSSCH